MNPLIIVGLAAMGYETAKGLKKLLTKESETAKPTQAGTTIAGKAEKTHERENNRNPDGDSNGQHGTGGADRQPDSVEPDPEVTPDPETETETSDNESQSEAT